MESRDEYIRITNNNMPRKFLVDFVEKYQIGNMCTEIGSGAGNDTLYLLEQGRKVCAIDGSMLSRQCIMGKIPNQYIHNFSFEQQSLSSLTLEESDLIYSS